MEDQTANLILTELREFRAAVTTWQQDTGERVSALETSVKSGITGNGQPSRLAVVENNQAAAQKSLEQLHRFKYWILGAAATIAAIAHYALPGGGR
jgi:hypothetical protein